MLSSTEWFDSWYNNTIYPHESLQILSKPLVIINYLDLNFKWLTNISQLQCFYAIWAMITFSITHGWHEIYMRKNQNLFFICNFLADAEGHYVSAGVLFLHCHGDHILNITQRAFSFPLLWNNECCLGQIDLHFQTSGLHSYAKEHFGKRQNYLSAHTIFNWDEKQRHYGLLCVGIPLVGENIFLWGAISHVKIDGKSQVLSDLDILMMAFQDWDWFKFGGGLNWPCNGKSINVKGSLWGNVNEHCFFVCYHW